MQKRIYQGFGGTREYNSEIWEKFGNKVGWIKSGEWLSIEDITFDIKAQEGHLPYRPILQLTVSKLYFNFQWLRNEVRVSSLASRLLSRREL